MRIAALSNSLGKSRSAGATLGRRFLRLVHGLVDSPLLVAAIAAAQATESDTHHCAAFGLAGAVLGIDEESNPVGLRSSISCQSTLACQRLLPLGQTQATRMLWALKPLLAELVRRAQENDFDIDQVACFAPLIEVGSMRHPTLPTRLFIS